MITEESEHYIREVLARIPYGTKEIRVCRITIKPTGEKLTELVDYVPQRAGTDADPQYGSGVFVPMDSVADVVHGFLKAWQVQ